MKFELTISLVTYCNNKLQIERLIQSVLNSKLNFHFVIIDHSPTPIFSYLRSNMVDKKISYFHNPENPGFGTGHNNAFKFLQSNSKFHLIVNPDIYFDENVLSNLLAYISENNNIGILIPKVLYPNGEIQKLAKLLPTPFTFLIRRFFPKALFVDYNNKFELQKYNYTHTLNVPFLSGCFMLFNSDVYNKIKGFDENIFMYTEDIDICRRVNKLGYKTVLYPFESVYHDHERKSILNMKTFKVFVKSYFYYFNKWGWFIDDERIKLNNSTLFELKKNNSICD